MRRFLLPGWHFPVLEPATKARYHFRHLAITAVCLLAACADAPTAPSAYVHPADGEMWVAVTVPAGLLEVDTRLPDLEPDDSTGMTVRDQIAVLRKRAEDARRVGELDRARALDEEALRTTVHALGRMPEPAVLQGTLAVLDLWARRVEAQVDLVRFPGLDSATVAVRSQRAEAAGLLQAGDTAAAVFALGQAVERVRDQSPSGVALRVLDRVEARIRGRPEGGVEPCATS